jgi:acyl-[acyl-carrier-protein]-phospholipid O-acyltransferase/long-chain-fatty-acid--[acyl-carrier-protein] ligase
MVPHMKLEDSVTALLEEHHTCAVTSIPDPAKGERLVVFFTDPRKEPQELWERLCRTELPRLWLPKREDLHFIESLPTLGSGKVDLRAVRQMAMDRMKPVAAGR